MTLAEKIAVAKAADAWTAAVAEHVLAIAFQSSDEPEKHAKRQAAHDAFLDVVYPLSRKTRD